MKWIILVYLAIYVGGADEDLRYKRLEFPAKDFQECIDITSQLNDITNAYKSNEAYVRSFYWVYNNMLHEIRAKCVFVDPTDPLPEWHTGFPGRHYTDSRDNLKNEQK